MKKITAFFSIIFLTFFFLLVNVTPTKANIIDVLKDYGKDQCDQHLKTVLHNNSSIPVYVKLENSSKAFELKPGYTTIPGVDGIWLSRSRPTFLAQPVDAVVRKIYSCSGLLFLNETLSPQHEYPMLYLDKEEILSTMNGKPILFLARWLTENDLDQSWEKPKNW
jgi:hypothetical protein